MTTDEEFLGYVEFHSKSERALFHVDDANRLFELAGSSKRFVSFGGGMIDFVPLHYSVIEDILREAKERGKNSHR